MDIQFSVKKRLCLDSRIQSSTTPLVSACYASTANAIIFINDSGEYYISDVYLENSLGPRPCGTNTLHAQYIRHRDCLIFNDVRGINGRRSLCGTFFLETALRKRRPSPKSGFATNDSLVSIELTINEAEMLFDSLEGEDKDDEAQEIFRAIEQQLARFDENKSKIEKKWARVLLHVVPETFVTLIRKLEDDALQLRPETLNVFTSIMERFRLTYEHPYTFSLNKDGTGYDKRYLVSEAARRMTLASWPHDYIYCSPDRLAEAGFFHQPNNRSDDRLLCFACNVCLISWEPTDEPWSEHERHNSNCPHLQDDPSTGNVPVAVTYAFSSALDMGNDLQINCVSRTNNCDWVVSSTTDGHICFFTIEKEFNKTDVIKLDPWSDGLVEHKEKNFPSKQSNKVLTVNCMSTVSRTRGTSRRHSRKQDDKIDYLLIGCDLEYKSSVKPCVLIYKLQQNIKTKMRETTTNKTDSVLNQPTISFGGGKTVKTSDIDKKLTEIINKDLEELQLITPDLGANLNDLDKGYNEISFAADLPADIHSEPLDSFYVEDIDEFSLEGDDETNADYPAPPTIIFDSNMTNENSNKMTSLHPKSENLLLSTTEDILRIGYEDFKPKIDLSPCQCLIMPDSLFSCDFSIKFIEFSAISSHVYVFVERSREFLTDLDIVSALLVYKFRDDLSGLEDTACRQFNFSKNDLNAKVKEIIMYNRTDKNGIPTDFMIILMSDGALLLLDTRDGHFLTKFTYDEKFTTVCHGPNNDIIAGSASANAFLIKIDDNECVFESSLNRLGKPMNSTDLLSQPLDCQHMRNVWELTQSSPLPFVDAQWSVHAPSCWSEVPLHRLLRQHTLHGDLSDDKTVKCYRLSPSTDSCKEQLFEIDLSSNVLLDHLNFKFTLRALPSSSSSLEISLLAQLPCCRNQDTLLVDSNTAKIENRSEDSTSEIMNGDALFIENSRFRVVDGPYELRDVLDNGSLFGLVQFCCPEFLEPNNRMFFVYIRTNSASAGLKRKHVHKKATRLCCGPKPLTLESTDSVDSMPDFIDASISLKSLAQFNQKFASQKCTNKFPRGKLSSDQLNGCNILLEVSLTLFCVSRSTPNDNMFREIFLSNEAYHNRLITSLHEPLHLLFPNATRFQLLVIDILFYAMRNLNSQKKKVVLHLHRRMIPIAKDIVLSVFLSDSRHLARNFVGFIVYFSEALKFDEEKFHEFLAVIRSTMLECAPVFLDRTNSAGCIVIYFALLQKMCQKLNKIIDLSSFTKALQKFGSLMSQKPGNNLNNELSERYRLNGRPFDLELFDFPHKALVWSSRMQKSSSYAGITSQGGTSLTNFVDILEEDETCWLNFLDLEQENNDVLPPVHPFQAKSVSSRIDIGREHLYGLLDVEPLSFELFSASDNVYVEDVKTREHLPILNRGRTSPIADDIISQVGSGTVKLRNFTFRKQAFSEITPEKFEQNHEANTLENSTDLCTLLPSSNSMPATPKTTPYAMTPGPSSPFHMTPPTQTVFVQESTLQDNFEDISKANKKLSEVSSNRFASEFLAPPSPKTVILERMTSLARRFVIMDFGQPILLTDILIPQSADLDSVSIDVWFLASNANLDTENNQPKLKRLVDSDEISHKSLSVCNLRPPVLCQYLRITYVGRCGLAPCISKVSIGSFFGLTCLPPVYGDSLDSEESHATKNASIIKSLRIFAQSLLYRYDSSCERLKAMLQNRQRICDELVILSTLQLVDITSYQTTLRKTYDECMLLKIQYNFVRRAIERLLDDDMGARKGGHTLKVGDFDCYTFADCSYDKLRFLCECLFTFCIRNAFFNNLQLYVSEHYASKHENDDYIAVICAMFNDFCCNGSPK